MADKGKRLIFCDECSPAAQEGVAVDADIMPGMFVKQSAAGLNKNTDASTVFGNQLLIADYDMLAAGTVDDTWTQNENMIARALPRDQRANVQVVVDNYDRIGIPLTSNGDGTFKEALTNGTEDIKCVTDEILNVTVAGSLIRVRGA